MVAQAIFGTDFYDRSILRPKHRAYYRSGRPVIKIGPKGALGSHEIRPIHSAPSFGQSIVEMISGVSSLGAKQIKPQLENLEWSKFIQETLRRTSLMSS